MLIYEPGHVYEIENRPYDKKKIKNNSNRHSTIIFVKRRCETNNHDYEHDGLITQDLLRVCLDRTEYLYKEQPCLESRLAGWCIRLAWWFFEKRAYTRHKAKVDGKAKHHNPFSLVPFWPWNIEKQKTNIEGHIE